MENEKENGTEQEVRTPVFQTFSSVGTVEVSQRPEPQEPEQENEEPAKEEVKKEKKQSNGEVKNFFKALFTTYLPTLLAVVALVCDVVLSLLVSVNSVNAVRAARWFSFFAWGFAVASVIMHTVKFMLNKKNVEFNPEFVFSLVVLFVTAI